MNPTIGGHRVPLLGISIQERRLRLAQHERAFLAPTSLQRVQHPMDPETEILGNVRTNLTRPPDAHLTGGPASDAHRSGERLLLRRRPP